MKQLLTKGIILSRIDYGEADRIITLLTPDHGKLRLMARGVRRVKSKLAGGVELFSVSDITFINGRGGIGTLISARLDHHYGTIVQSLERVQLGYELIKLINRATEDHPEAEYFRLLQQAFEALDDSTIDIRLIQVWFQAALLKQAGYTPNLYDTQDGQKLQADQVYNFDFETMGFVASPRGLHNATTIKALRLLFDGHKPIKLQKVQGISTELKALTPLIRTMLTDHIRTGKY